MASQQLDLAVAGVVTTPNPFGASPQGSFALANNCVIRNSGILEARRGFLQHSLSGATRLSSFQGRLIGAGGTSLAYYDAGSWHTYSGSYSPPTGAPMRFAQAAKNLLILTDLGPYTLDEVTNTPRQAGVPRCGTPQLAAVSSTNTMWLPTGMQVSYRFVLARTDSHKNLILGAPSGPILVANNLGSNKAVNIEFDNIPTWMRDPTYVLRYYRSAAVSTATAPLDEMYLAGEYQITSDDIASTLIGFNDVTAEADLGAALYTNATQEGIGQENDQPPQARDVCLFKGTTIYANTTDRHRLLIRLLRVDPPFGMQSGDTILINSAAGSDTYTAGSFESVPGKQFAFDSTNVENTMRSFCHVLNQATKVVQVRADYISPVDVTPGQVLIEDLQLGQIGWNVSFSAQVQAVSSLGVSMSRTAGTVDLNMNTAHTFVVGDRVLLGNTSTPDPDFPLGVKLILSIPSTHAFTYAELGPDAVSINHTYTATRDTSREWTPVGAADLIADNNSDPAGVSYSKPNQPGAVPLENGDTLGDPSSDVLRVVALRDSVLVFKADGLYRLTGNDPTDFTIAPYDLTAILACPETAVALSDTVFFYSTKGVCAASESAGVVAVDKAINEMLLKALATQPQLATGAFGIAYEAEQEYELYLPSISTNPGFPYTFPVSFTGNSTGVVLVFNVQDGTWTTWDVPAAHGIIDPSTNKITLVDGGQVIQERKNYDVTDYQDIGGSATISAVTDSTHITMIGPGVGDLITQGSNTARVLSLVGSVLTLDTAGSWSTATAMYARAIKSDITWLPAAGQNPGTTKQFKELALNFRQGNFSWITATFSTDVSQTTESTLRYGRPTLPTNVSVRTLMPVNMSRGVAINCGFTHQQALSNFQLQSASLIYRMVSTRTPTSGRNG